MSTFSKKPVWSRRVAACCAMLVVSGLSHAGPTIDRIQATKTITIAYREASVPFSFLDADRKPVGYAIDLCLKIADAVKRELKLPTARIAWVPVTPATRIGTIKDGKADLECGSTTNNAERRREVAFTVPHFVAAARMLVRTDSGIHNWADLRGRKVVTTKGTTSVKLLNTRDKVRSLNLQLVEGADHDKSFAMVESGQADAFPMDDVLLYGLRASAKDPASLVVVGDPLSAEPYAIMLSRDDPAFKTIVDREMGRIINDGEIYKLYDKWFKSPLPAKNMINMNMPMGYLLREMFRFPSDKVAD